MHRLIGKEIKDPNGIEIGTISGLEEGYYEVEEGLLGKFLLDVNMAIAVGDEVTLDANIQTLLAGETVLDKSGVEVGKVHDVMEVEDIVDFILIESGERLLSAPIENIAKIGDEVELRIDREELEYIQDEHSLPEEIVHALKRFFNPD